MLLTRKNAARVYLAIQVHKEENSLLLLVSTDSSSLIIKKNQLVLILPLGIFSNVSIFYKVGFTCPIIEKYLNWKGTSGYACLVSVFYYSCSNNLEHQ